MPSPHPERLVRAGYFRTVGIPQIAGRDFQPSDGADAPLMVALSEAAAAAALAAALIPAHRARPETVR